MEPGSHRVHHLLTGLVRRAGVVLTERAVPCRPVSLSQLFALHELDVGGRISQRELGDRLGLEKSTVSRLVADLESDGLLTRERDPGNRRLYLLAITDAGRRLHHEMAGAFHVHYERWTGGMSDEELRGLQIGLAALMREMRRDGLFDTRD